MSSRTSYTRTVSTALVAGAVLLAHVAGSPAGMPGEYEDGSGSIEGAHGYHLRLVRIAVDPDEPGAAIGLGTDAGVPVVVPSDEVWGTDEQIAGLRDLLGVASAEPVTGYFLQSQDAAEFRFERTVYLGATVAELSFRALPPETDGRAHRVSITLVDSTAPDPPMAEATLLLATDRTVAIAIPTADRTEGVVVAVTPVSPGVTAAAVKRVAPVVPLDGEVAPPTVVRKIAPRYPENARASGLQGEVILQVLLDREGVPRAPMVLRMTPGCEELAGAAVDAIRQWRYEPARAGDEPVAVWFTVNIVFRLE